MGSLLVDVLSQLAESDYPALILVDAQRATFERLQLLRRLKENQQLRQIPVVVFVSPSQQLLVKGYDHQANSVVLLPNRADLFDELMARLLHYWLRVVRLPQSMKK